MKLDLTLQRPLTDSERADAARWMHGNSAMAYGIAMKVARMSRDEMGAALVRLEVAAAKEAWDKSYNALTAVRAARNEIADRLLEMKLRGWHEEDMRAAQADDGVRS